MPPKLPFRCCWRVGAVHHHLIREGKRMRASLVCESGAARDVHHFACLVAYGASAVNPYIAIDTIRQSVESGEYGDIRWKGHRQFPRAPLRAAC